jgi:hypothetical protein
MYLMELWEARGSAQCVFMCLVAGEVARRITEGMPPMGPPEECN